MKILYIDPIFGISGDMMISALIDAGLPFEELHGLLSSLPLPLPSIIPEKKGMGVIEGVHLNIGDSDTHLSIREMEEVIAGLNIEDSIKEDAGTMLAILLNAESAIHGISKEELHLHELAHIDTLIDFLSVAKGIGYFGVEKVYCGPIPHGRGTIKTSHGIIPNPPPLTLNILTGYENTFLDVPLELTTPTGATIVHHYVKTGDSAPPFTIEKIGYGMGGYKTEKPDVLRIFIGDSGGIPFEEEVWLIEVDLDDMEMEYMGAVADRIRGRGALDVLYFPVYMKKGRMGMRLSVTVNTSILPTIVDMILSETTTFGMRLRKEQRRILRREETVMETSYGPVRIKNGYDHKGKLIKTHIEFDDVKKMAEAKNIPYRVLLEMLKREVGG